MTPTRLVLALAAAGVIGGAGATLLSGSPALAQAPGVVATSPDTAPTNVIGAPGSSRIAQRAAAAVVNISVSGMSQASKVAGDSGAPSVAIPIDLATKVVATLGGANDRSPKVAKADDAVGNAILLWAAGIAERNL